MYVDDEEGRDGVAQDSDVGHDRHDVVPPVKQKLGRCHSHGNTVSI